MQRQIPARPGVVRHNLEQYRKQAKDLVREAPSMKLAEAQWTIAQQHGFKTWAEFKNHIEAQAAVEVMIPKGAEGLVLMPFHSKDKLFAEVLNRAGFGTALVDLRGIIAAAESLQSNELRLGYFGFEEGAAAVLLAAAERPDLVNAVVSSRGRHNLAGPWLSKVEAPCLFVVDVNDRIGVEFQASAMQGLSPSTLRMYQIVDIPEKSIALACDWFRWHLAAKEVAR